MGRALVSAVRKPISPPIYSADSPQANLEGVGLEHKGYLVEGSTEGETLCLSSAAATCAPRGRKSRSDFDLTDLPPGVRSARKTVRRTVFSENGPAGPGRRRSDRQIRIGGSVGGGYNPPPKMTQRS